MSKTALNLHIDMMKSELKEMESTNVKFGLLLQLIRQASTLLSLEQLEIMDAYHEGRLDHYRVFKKSSLEFYEQKYKTETEVS
jgi:hypothetical protein